jgi:peptidoglycan/LPS O-acetylase OafA/YrhL
MGTVPSCGIETTRQCIRALNAANRLWCNLSACSQGHMTTKPEPSENAACPLRQGSTDAVPSLKERLPRIPELDGVRGIAILLVLIWHYLASHPNPEPGTIGAYFAKALALTWAGVDLFFVLSGFLIGGILFRNREAENLFTVFYTRRAARIFPLYMIVVGLYAISYPLLLANGSGAALHLATGGDIASPIPLWTYPLYLQNFSMAAAEAWGGHWLAMTWSLAVEEQFYLLAPLLIWLLPAAHVRWVLVNLIALSPLIRLLAAIAYHNPLGPYVLLPCRWDGLLLGMLAAFELQDPRKVAWMKRNEALVLQSAVLGVAVLIAFSLLGITRYTLAMTTLGHTLIALAATSVLLAALYSDCAPLRAVFRNPLLCATGRMSYGIYLIHMAVLGLAFLATTGSSPSAATLADLAIILSATVATFILAAFSWRYFETPLIALGHRVRYCSAGLKPVASEATPAVNPTGS